jgi:hypothetical protein
MSEIMPKAFSPAFPAALRDPAVCADLGFKGPRQAGSLRKKPLLHVRDVPMCAG